jgi:hypothetical protein
MKLTTSTRALCAAALLAALYVPRMALAQDSVHVSQNAPRDRPAGTTELCQWRALVAAEAPYVARARASFPAAKARFLHGLRPRESFFVTVMLTDSLNHHEQVFVAVDSMIGNRISGRIWSQILVVQGYRYGERYQTRDADVLDWMFAEPDGTEDGNVVGKFLDTYQPPHDCRASQQHAG